MRVFVCRVIADDEKDDIGEWGAVHYHTSHLLSAHDDTQAIVIIIVIMRIIAIITITIIT